MLGLFATVLHASGTAPDPADDRYYGASSRWSPRPTNAGVSVSPDIAMTLSTVFASVNLLSKVVASLNCLVYKKNADGDWIEAPQMPLQDVIGLEPNPWMSAFDFWAFMVHHLVLRGNAYAQIVGGARGAVDQLIPLHPDRVQMIRLQDGSLAYDVNDWVMGVKGRFLPAEIFHVKSHLSPNGLQGVGAVTYAMQSIGLALAAEQHGARMFQNGARPSGVVSIKENLSDEAWNRFKDRMKSENSGLSNTNRTMILEGGATFDAVQMTADEIQFLQTRAFQVEEICRWFDVPAVLLHHTDNSTSFGTGIEAVMLAFVRNNLMPWLVSIQQAVRRQLITVPQLYKAEFDTSGLMRGDSVALSAFLQKTVFTGILTRNDGRRILGYNPLPGLDIPLVPVTQAAPQDGPPGAEPPIPSAPDDPPPKPPVAPPAPPKKTPIPRKGT